MSTIWQVRSATLDTWLPEQVAFIQCEISLLLAQWLWLWPNSVSVLIISYFAAMGNERSNSFWEADLPPNYDRVGIENFIRAKYVLR